MSERESTWVEAKEHWAKGINAPRDALPHVYDENGSKRGGGAQVGVKL